MRFPILARNDQVIYYPFFPADYAVDTAQLSDIEDLMYRRLLDAYYTQERPLTSDRERLYRLVRAFSAKHKRAVDFIIESFFELKNDHYHNRKADQEIERYKASVEQCRKAGKASAEKRKQSVGNSTNVPTVVTTDAPTPVATPVPTTRATRRSTTNPTTQTHTYTQTHGQENRPTGKVVGREEGRGASATNNRPPPSLSIEDKDKKMTLELFNSLSFDDRQDFEVYYRKYHHTQEPRWRAMKDWFKRNQNDNRGLGKHDPLTATGGIRK